jgi:hypothetical protein
MSKVVNLKTVDDKKKLADILIELAQCYDEMDLLDTKPRAVISLVVSEDNGVDLVIHPYTVNVLEAMGALDIARQNILDSLYLKDLTDEE